MILMLALHCFASLCPHLPLLEPGEHRRHGTTPPAAPFIPCISPPARPQVSWEDIGGLEEVKQRIREAVELPFKEPEALRRLGVVPPSGPGWGRSVGGEVMVLMGACMMGGMGGQMGLTASRAAKGMGAALQQCLRVHRGPRPAF